MDNEGEVVFTSSFRGIVGDEVGKHNAEATPDCLVRTL